MVTLTITQLPPELISNVLSFVDLEDLPRINLTCRHLYHTVRGNTALFRALYLNNLVSRRGCSLGKPSTLPLKLCPRPNRAASD